MHPLMQNFRDQLQAERESEALASLVVERAAPPARAGVTRRGVLTAGAAGGLVVAIGGWMPQSAKAAGQGAEGAAAKAVFEPNQFVSVGTDNIVTIVNKHHEMGQGNTTGLASLAADELDADWSLVRTEYAGSNVKLYANLAFGMQGTGGSSDRKSVV